ncbi:MAG: ACT domain-containing protein [Mesorhizobium sp.]|nr:MAG: ACT domain-containing protein [Mesorhizobium sp.]
MTGETDLQRLLASMTPQLLPDVHVFATLAPGTAVPDGLDPVMQFREREGLTLIVSEDQAKVAGLAGTFRCRMITLDIVGFLAAITTRLAAAGMGVNPVSAFYHDHLFVPAERAEEALGLLRQLAAESSG